jgi:uncharacterized protein involved in outer membrane biogenesis
VLGRIFVVIGGILVVALFAALFAPYFVDWTDFRRDFETQASRIIGKKVVVHGSVDARLLPFPAVTMTDVRVGEDASGEALVTADSFSMESELAPFLSGEALIYNMRIVHPRIKMRLTEDGTLDWVKTGTPQIPASTVILENVAIDDGEVLFTDEQTGRSRHLTGLDMKLSAKTLAGPWKASGTGVIDGQPGSFVLNTSVPEDGKVFLKMRLLPASPAIVAELEGSLGLSGLRPLYAGSFRLRERYRTESAGDDAGQDAQQSAAPRISGEFELQNDRLRIPSYEFKMGDPADPYVVTGEATIDAGRDANFLLTAVGQQIDMTRFGTPVEGSTKVVPLRDRLRAALILAADIPIPQMPGRATVTLPALVADDTVIRDITLDMRPDRDGWRIDKAEAHLPGRTTLSASGKLTLAGNQAFEGDLLLASRQPSGFAEWVTGKVPDTVRKLKSAGFSANVALTPDLQRFENLEIAFGGAHLAGRLEHTMNEGEVATLSTELSGNRFDLDTVMALGGLLTGESAIGEIFDHRISARLNFDSFSAFGLEATGFDTTFALADGAISGARLAIRDFYGAAVTLEGGFAGLTTRPKGDAKITVKSPDPQALLALLARRLPPHPVLARLASSSGYYAGSDFVLGLKLGEGDWPIEADLSGTANGSRIAARLAAQTLDLANSGGLTFDATIENPDAWIMLGQAGLPTNKFDADRDGILTLRIDQPADADSQVDLSYASGTTTVSLKGQTALDATHFLNGSYAVSIDSGDFAPYLIMSGVTLPRIAEGLPLAATATVYTTAEAVGIEAIAGRSDDNAFNGILSLDRTVPAPVLAGELAFTSVDLTWLAESIYGQVADPSALGLSRLPVPAQSGLPASVDIALTADSFEIGALGTVDSFTGHLKASPGRLDLTKARGKFSTGTFKADVELGNTQGNAYFRTRLGITDAALKTAFWQFAGQPAADARASLSLVIDATGTSPHAMMQTATGSGTLDLTDIRIAGINRKALPPILAGTDALTGDLDEARLRPIVESALFSGALDLDRLRIPFAITGARLRADTVSSANADVRLEAEGSLSLEDGALDGRIDTIFQPGEQAVAGADPAVSLNWTGSFNAPDLTVDLTQMTSYLSLRRFEQERRKVEILQARMSEKQRLRREAALYRARQTERERLRQREIDNARILERAQAALKALARKEAEERAKALELQDRNLLTDPAGAVPAQ